MRVKCEYCGSWIDESDSACPNCGAPNAKFKRAAEGVPTTIDELKKWAAAHNLPLDQMRTYIGENHKGPRAFGIYYDENTKNYIVYKNKDSGERAVRYQGPDEAYAVNELYLKMKERVAVQKAAQAAGGGKASQKKPKRSKFRTIRYIAIALFIVFVIWCMVSPNPPKTGYYSYMGNTYYYQRADSSWYLYDTLLDDWDIAYPDSKLTDSSADYYNNQGYTQDSNFSDFSNTSYYEKDDETQWSNSKSWDSDTNWDTGTDWDTGYDDWDSDW